MSIVRQRGDLAVSGYVGVGDINTKISKDGSGNLVLEDTNTGAQTLGQLLSSNPFDQPLNTTNDVQFEKMVLNLALGDTVDEAVLDIIYDVNKASGNDTCIKITRTDTASPGTSKIFSYVAGTEKLQIGEDGSIWVQNNITGSQLAATQFAAAPQFLIQGAALGITSLAGVDIKINPGGGGLIRAHSLVTDEGTAALNLGTAASTSHTLGSGDVLLGGQLEVDGDAYFDADVLFQDTSTKIYKDGAGNLILQDVNAGVKTLSSLISGNPFDQDLNTTDEVEFESITLDPVLAGTGDEVVLDIPYEVNKASGNDTVIKVTRTDTASPGTSKLLSYVSGNEKLQIGEDGSIWVQNNITGSQVAATQKVAAPQFFIQGSATGITSLSGLDIKINPGGAGVIRAHSLITDDGLGALNIGSAATTTHTLATGDVLLGGKLEVDGDAYFDSDIFLKDTSTKLYRDGLGNLVFSDTNAGAQTLSTLAAGGNPFDQTLNTTDSPQFAGLTLNGTLTTTGTNNLDITTGGAGIVRVGKLLSDTGSGPLNLGTSYISIRGLVTGDVTVGNKFEVGAAAYFEEAIRLRERKLLQIGGNSTRMCNITADTAGVKRSLSVSLGDLVGRAIVIGDESSILKDFGLGVQTHPTLALFAAGDPSLNPNDHGKMHHDSTDFFIESGAGGIRLSSASDVVYIAVGTSAPADASLINGEIAAWADEPGNKLNFKVKYSTGTVKSGSIPLT